MKTIKCLFVLALVFAMAMPLVSAPAYADYDEDMAAAMAAAAPTAPTFAGPVATAPTTPMESPMDITAVAIDTTIAAGTCTSTSPSYNDRCYADADYCTRPCACKVGPGIAAGRCG